MDVDGEDILITMKVVEDVNGDINDEETVIGVYHDLIPHFEPHPRTKIDKVDIPEVVPQHHLVQGFVYFHFELLQHMMTHHRHIVDQSHSENEFFLVFLDVEVDLVGGFVF